MKAVGQKPRLFSGMRPTGAQLHLGNYLGALKNWVSLQAEYDCIFSIVDLHAMTTDLNVKALPERIFNVVLDYLSAGLDPKKCAIFLQSERLEHTYLAWILSCLTPMGELSRMIQYKEKSKEQGKTASVGLFTYPVLMAADILIYKAQFVPVGEDQIQHVEFTRIAARNFNRQFGNTFPEPNVLLTKTARVMSLADPTKKMSKSLGSKHYIALTDGLKTVRQKVMSAITDSAGSNQAKQQSAAAAKANLTKMSPGVANLFGLWEACAGDKKTIAQFKIQQQAGKLKYADLKEIVAATISAMLKPIQERRKQLIANRDYAAEILIAGLEKTRRLAQATIQEVKEKCGLLV